MRMVYRMRALFMLKKGTSAVFTILLLTILTVAAGVMFYNYVTRCVDSMKTNLATQLNLCCSNPPTSTAPA